MPRRIGHDHNFLQMYLTAEGFFNAIQPLQKAENNGRKNLMPPLLMTSFFCVELCLKTFKRGTSDSGYLKTHDLWELWEDLDAQDQIYILNVNRAVVEQYQPDLGGKDPDDAFLEYLQEADNYFEDIRYFYQAERPYFGDLSGHAIALWHALVNRWPKLRTQPFEISKGY